MEIVIVGEVVGMVRVGGVVVVGGGASRVTCSPRMKPPLRSRLCSVTVLVAAGFCIFLLLVVVGDGGPPPLPHYLF